VDKFFTIDEVVFAQRGDLALLGSRAMEGMNIQVDARRKRLVAAGPVVAATAIRPALAKAMGIIVKVPRKTRRIKMARKSARPRSRRRTRR